MDASKANLLLDPVTKLSKFLFGSILLYWRNESFIKDTLSVIELLLDFFKSLEKSLDLILFLSSITNSILIIIRFIYMEA